MAATTQVPVEEYLRTDYSPDCEYVDGEVLERNVGEKGHGKIQKRLMVYFAARETELGIFALQEWRVRLGERHYRVPDILVVAGPEPSEEILTRPPFLCIEVLSPEDRMSRMLKKVADYIAFGVQYVWILDPKRRKATVYTDRETRELDRGVLRTENPTIEVPLSAVFD
jgi:Uma2 family endonuclease